LGAAAFYSPDVLPVAYAHTGGGQGELIVQETNPARFIGANRWSGDLL
jgi:hypothetical protein